MEKIGLPKKMFLSLVLIGITFCVFLFAAIGLATKGLSSSVEPLPAGKTIIFDMTDAKDMTKSQLTACKEEFQSVAASLSVNERLTLYVIEKSKNDFNGEATMRFSMCRPRDGSRARFLDENPSLLKRNFKENFQKPLAREIESLSLGENAATTPLLETIRKIVTDPAFAEIRKHELIIVSNLLQHTDQISLYGNGWENFDQLLSLSLLVLDVKDILHETNVTIFLLPDKHYKPSHEAWWQSYFRFLGAANITVKRL